MIKPRILELAGLPAAGKTTTAHLLREKLEKRRLSCAVLPEAANNSPLLTLKRQWQFNAWVLCRNVMNILECNVSPSHDLVVLDRGLVDALCWIRWFRLRGKIENRIADAIESFTQVHTWFQRLELVIVLRVEFETALERHHGISGRILNSKTFEELHKAYDEVLSHLIKNQLVKDVRILDTDDLSCLDVLDRTLTFMNDAWPLLMQEVARQR